MKLCSNTTKSHQTVRAVPISPQIFGNNSISLVKPARIVIKN